MYLKAIELHGFKSFPDKTRVTFDRGMSAVVGPNGSGKSNISDAIRWVLGETRSKELRGSGKMEDIIFGGTQKRSPMGFASVSLILNNSNRSFDMESDEVVVTRKYYRGGDSEYLINSNKVRLKDIYELFLDTGLGKNGYSMVGQGKISEIVTSKPEGRREIFEEASGISKFRYKKNEAEKNLAHAQDNITRLTDILLSLEERVGPLEKESKKAKEFIELSDKKKNLEISLWLNTVDNSKEVIRAEQRKLEIFQNDYQAIEEQLEDKEKYIEERYLKANEALSKSDENNNLIRAIEQEISEFNSQKAVLLSRIEYNSQNLEQLNNQLAEFDNQDVDIKQKSDKINQDIADINAKIEQFKTEQIDIEEKLILLSDKAKNADGKKGELLTQINNYNQSIQDKNITFHSLKTQNSSLATSYENAKNSLEQAGEHLEVVSKQVDELNGFVDASNDEIQKNTNIKNGINIKLSSATQKHKENENLLLQNVAKQNEISQRIRLLTDMENNLDGFAQSVRVVLNQSKKGALQGILGSVAQLISVQKGYETAVEIALGYALQNVVVENSTSAKRAMEYLKNSKGGRATFLPLDTIKPSFFKENLPSYARTGDTVISADDKYKNVISNLLGRTIFVEDINLASKLAKELQYRYKIVTLDGQQINAGGSFTGGSVSKSAGLFSRKGEIEKLKVSLKEYEEKYLLLENDKEKTQDNLDLLNTQISACDSQIEIVTQDKINAELELAKQNQILEQYENNLEMQQAIMNSATKVLQENKLKEENILFEIKNQEELLETAKQTLENMGDEDSKDLALQAEYTQSLQNIKFDILKLDNEVVLNQNNLEQLELLATEKVSRKQSLISQVELIEQENNDKLSQIDVIVKNVETAKIQITQKEQENKDFVALRMEIEKERNEITSQNRQLFTQKEDLSKQIVKLSEKINTIESSYDEIITKLWEDYELTVQTAQEFRTEVQDEVQGKKELAVLKLNIKKLGNVNVGAIEEYKEVFEKYNFLKQQLEDLDQSKNQLIKLITSLNGEMKTLFTESFEIINNNFKNIFVELFGGGSASLKLTNPEDVLSSGVDIQVNPPGKVIKSLTSLSGGEQAMVAISLYFAILAHNPSPFCILDEIEAALDDVNVTRYANYLHRISDQTQFIVITHRRGTMEAADILYGVTMQEDGISKLLKLDVNNLSPSILN